MPKKNAPGPKTELDNSNPVSFTYTETRELRDLHAHQDNPFDLRPDAETLRQISRYLGLIELRKLRFHGVLKSQGKADWRLLGQLGATALQACVVSNEPVTTRIDLPVERLYLRDFQTAAPGSEVEFDGEIVAEALESTLDLASVLIEELTLALPDYPRKEGVELDDAVYTASGITPMQDQDTKPFASLAALRDKLKE